MKKTLYIESPPDTIPCAYCGEDCIKTQPYTEIVEYFCNNHGDVEVMFRCAHHKIEGPNWFFNGVKVTRDGWRLSWNFYAGKLAWVEKFVPAQDRKWGSHWTKAGEIPALFLYSPVKMISSFLNLYRVFS